MTVDAFDLILKHVDNYINQKFDKIETLNFLSLSKEFFADNVLWRRFDPVKPKYRKKIDLMTDNISTFYDFFKICFYLLYNFSKEEEVDFQCRYGVFRNCLDYLFSWIEIDRIAYRKNLKIPKMYKLDLAFQEYFEKNIIEKNFFEKNSYEDFLEYVKSITVESIIKDKQNKVFKVYKNIKKF